MGGVSHAGWELGSALRRAPAVCPPCRHQPFLCRTGERPELCRVSLPEFQQFLLEYQGVCLGLGVRLVEVGGAFTTARGLSHACHLSHAAQELWAVDRLQVQEFMLSFLRDPLREIEEPYFFLDEVSPTDWTLPGDAP